MDPVEVPKEQREPSGNDTIAFSAHAHARLARTLPLWIWPAMLSAACKPTSIQMPPPAGRDRNCVMRHSSLTRRDREEIVFRLLCAPDDWPINPEIGQPYPERCSRDPSTAR